MLYNIIIKHIILYNIYIYIYIIIYLDLAKWYNITNNFFNTRIKARIGKSLNGILFFPFLFFDRRILLIRSHGIVIPEEV